MKTKIELDRHSLLLLYNEIGGFVLECFMDKKPNPSELLIVEKIQKLGNKVFKKICNNMHFSENKMINLNITHEELVYIRLQVKGNSLWECVANSENYPVIGALDQKIKSL